MTQLPRTLALVLVCAAISNATLRTPAADAQAPASRPVPCAAPEHRQFDFWLGEWEVTANGKLAGTNRITRLYGDCGLREEYTTPGGYEGTSFNVFDTQRRVWHQTWVDNQGGALLLDGGLRDGRMVLEAERPPVDGKTTRERITWTPNADGTVRQHWEQSTDGGKSWTTAFDGLYRRVTRGATPAR